MTRDQILETMAYLGYIVRDKNGNITPRAWATATALIGKITEHHTASPRIFTEWQKHEVMDHECEFCGDTATHSELFDNPVFVCDSCHA